MVAVEYCEGKNKIKVIHISQLEGCSDSTMIALPQLHHSSSLAQLSFTDHRHDGGQLPTTGNDTITVFYSYIANPFSKCQQSSKTLTLPGK